MAGGGTDRLQTLQVVDIRGWPVACRDAAPPAVAAAATTTAEAAAKLL